MVRPRKVVVCPVCGEKHKTTGTTKFQHCGEMFHIKDHRLIKPKMVDKGRDKVCFYTHSRLKYVHPEGYQCDHSNCENKHRCPGFGQQPPEEVEVMPEGDKVVQSAPYGFGSEDIEVIEGRTNPNAPPASMMNLLIGEYMHTDGMAFTPDGDKDQPSKIFYSRRYNTVSLDYYNHEGQKIILPLEELDGYDGYYKLPSGHPQRDVVFVYHQYGMIRTYKDGNYHIKVDRNGNPRFVHQLIFWHKEDGFFFYNVRERIMKGFIFEKDKKYKYFPPGELKPKEGELFSKISEDYCYKVIDTLRNEEHHRDNMYYGYLVEYSHIGLVKALAQRLTRPGQMQHYPGLSSHQRSLLFEKGILSSYEPRTGVFIEEYKPRASVVEKKIDDLKASVSILKQDVTISLDAYFKAKPSKYQGTYVTERAFFKEIELALRASGFFRLKGSFELFGEFKSFTKKFMNDESYKLTDERGSRSKSVNEWMDIKEVYDSFECIKHFIKDGSVYIDEVLIDLKEELSLERLQSKAFKDLVGLIGIKPKTPKTLTALETVIKFFEPFNFTVNVEKWLTQEYLKWQEEQSQEEDALTVWEDDDFTVTEIPDRKDFYSHIVDLTPKGYEKLERYGNKVKEDIVFEGYIAKSPFPRTVKVKGYETLGNLYKEDKETKEEMVARLAYHDGDITIIHKDGNYDKNLMDDDYTIKAGLKTTAIIGASQIVKKIRAKSHHEKLYDNVEEVIDDAPLIKAIMGYLLGLKNRPEVLLCGMANGVDMASAIAVFLLNEVYGWTTKVVFCSPGNIVEELKRMHEAFFNYCYQEGHTFISFIKEDYEFDLSKVDEYDPHYYLRNKYMAENANIVVDFVSKNVGGTKATCTMKQEARKHAQQLRAKAKAARKAAQRADERDGLSSNKAKYFKDLAKIFEEQSKKIDGKVVTKLSDYVRQEPIYNFDPSIIVPSPREIGDGLECDRLLCEARAAIVRTFAFDEDVGYGRGNDFFRYSLRDLIISIRVIMGSDYEELILDPVKATFAKIIDDDQTLAELDFICNNDKSEEYYELLAEHYNRRFEIEPPGFFCPNHGKKDVDYGDLYSVDHQRVNPEFIELMKKRSRKYPYEPQNLYDRRGNEYGWKRCLYNVDKYPIIIPATIPDYTGWNQRIFAGRRIHTNTGEWQIPFHKGAGKLDNQLDWKCPTPIWNYREFRNWIEYNPGSKYLILYGTQDLL